MTTNETVKIKRSVSGTVVSDAMDKTIVVKTERKVKHALYGKFITRSTKLHAHDPENQANVGDTVTVEECRPYSKSKTWKLVSVDAAAK